MSSPDALLPVYSRVLVVSPHFDDAALSAWALLDRRSIHPTDVVTVFGGAPEHGLATTSDRSSGFRDGAEAVAARRLEDLDALADVVDRRWWLPLLDQQYVNGPRTASEAEALASAVVAWLEEHGGPGVRLAVAIPAGAGVRLEQQGQLRPDSTRPPRGGAPFAWLRELKHKAYVRRKSAVLAGRAPAHPDHLFVRDTLLDALTPHHRTQVILYDELPYSWSASAGTTISSVLARREMRVRPIEVPVDRNRKQASLSNYRSQLSALDPSGRLHDADSLPECERYWTISSPAHD